MPRDPLWDETGLEMPEADPHADAGIALRLALKRIASLMRSHSIQADVAAPSGLLVRMRGPALTGLLEEMLAEAIQTAPASRMLMTVAGHGDWVGISVTDDVPGADPDMRRAGMRNLMERVALRGGTLDVDVRPGQGTTMTLRLGSPGNERRGPAQQAPSNGPSVASVSSFSSGMSR